jgi:hypothetical protein
MLNVSQSLEIYGKKQKHNKNRQGFRDDKSEVDFTKLVHTLPNNMEDC